jgi:hypothetical protein
MKNHEIIILCKSVYKTAFDTKSKIHLPFGGGQDNGPFLLDYISNEILARQILHFRGF